ncbi:MAG: hypothetical protein R3A10_05775 [Caldilineaceae bacterium]
MVMPDPYWSVDGNQVVSNFCFAAGSRRGDSTLTAAGVYNTVSTNPFAGELRPKS